MGTVTDSVENSRVASWFNRQPAIVLDIKRQPGANVIETGERVRGLLPHLRAAFPPTVQLTVLADRTETIRASINDVQVTLCVTVGLGVIGIFVFARSPRDTVIPSSALPLH